MKIARPWAATALLLLAAAPQDTREARIVEVKRETNRVRFVVAGDFPDDTILSCSVAAEQEYMLHGREIRILPQQGKEALLERQAAFAGRRFTVSFLSRKSGFYRINLVYNKSAQVLPEVLETLGALKDTSWSHAFLAIDPESLPEELDDHAPKVLEWVVRATKTQEMIEKAMADPARWKEEAQEVLKEIGPLAAEAHKYAQSSPYHACMETLVQAISKMANFDPGVSKPNFAPGSAEEAMAQSMSEDIPGELSDEFLKKQIRAFLARVRAALPRERLIVPSRILLTEWGVLLAKLGTAKASPEEIETAQAAFDAALTAFRRNIDLLRRQRDMVKQIDPEALKDIDTMGGQMAELAADRARARGELNEALDTKIRKLRENFSMRDKQVRLVPK
jgi:hypothetical protein